MRRALQLAAAAYLAVLVASWIAMETAPRERPLPEDRLALEVPARDGEGAVVEGAAPVRLAYLDLGPAGAESVVLMLHGSPGSAGDFRRLAGPLAATGRRVIAPDLPGFGASHWHVPDYSVRAHAAYAFDLLDALGVADAHAIGFSMGGGVALEMIAARPARVRSLTLLAALGVEELELLGDHDLNHALHVLQVGAFRAARWLLPHFGALDRSFLSVQYARNFADTDQRRLRPILESMEQPTLILHGEGDFLVPVAAAREHARIVPQARLRVFGDGAHHFLPWLQPDEVLAELAPFLDAVDGGRAATRATAPEERVAAAARPFDPADVPPFEGPALFAILVLLALLTFASEDLACIGAGLLVADGRIGWIAASAACFVGIFVGDMLLYLAGRTLGRPALTRAPLKWVAPASAVDRASHWFERKGVAVIFLSRFTPGLRLPTYVAAGVLRTSFLRFALFFAIAGVLWTPALVGIAAVAGERLREFLHGGAGLWGLLILIVLLLTAFRTIPLLLTHRGRRILRGKWLRLTRFEFWPPWIAYLPILPWIVWLALRHRGLSKPTATNPAMPAGGFVGESKSEILAGLGPGNREIPGFALLRAASSADERAAAALSFARDGAGLPVVLKPDSGQRGSGVEVVRSVGDLDRRVRALAHDAIVQEFVPGEEFGVFYAREPGRAAGRVFSLTTKVLPTVEGDGRRTVEELLLDDPRACAMHARYLDELGPSADDVPAPGEVRRLVEVGTHARGAIFLDGGHLVTPELEAAIERIAGRYEGFDFGRFDVRAPDAEALSRGEGIRVIELNGVTSEATDAYDPKHSLVSAYGVLYRQWDLAYRIGAANAARGVPTTGLLGLLRAWSRYRKLQRGHAGPVGASAAPDGPTRS